MIRRRRSLFILMLWLISISMPVQAAETFKIAKMDSPDHILIMRIMAKAYGELQIPVEFLEFPGKRALLQSSTGAVDAELSRVYEVGSAYPSLLRVPTPIFWFEPTAFSKKVKFDLSGWESLKGYRIGIMRGMLYAEDGVRGFPRVELVGDPDRLFKFLDADRVDIVVFSDINGQYLIQTQKLTKIFPLIPGLGRINAYHYLHEKHRDLLSKLDQVLQKMKRSGELEAMREQFVQEMRKL